MAWKVLQLVIQKPDCDNIIIIISQEKGLLKTIVGRIKHLRNLLQESS